MFINNYKVYLHTNLFNHKKYVGITKVSEKTRWNNGNGYKTNKKFYQDIQKYGWENGFSHEIIEENISYKEARSLEKYYITKYNSVTQGYNNANFNLGNSFQFDLVHVPNTCLMIFLIVLLMFQKVLDNLFLSLEL